MVAAPGGAQMTGDNPKVLSAGGISMNRLVSVAASAAFLLVAGAAAAKGYTLPTRDGRCAVWITTESDPAPGESASWSGECRNGLAQGFGIQAFERADGSRLRYVGHVRDGRWHGLGRLHQFAADGGLLHVVEGVFEQGIEQGVFDELVLDHPQNVPISNLRPPGREVGPAAVQVQQFYADGAAVLMCAPEADCAREAVTEGYDARRRPLDGELDRVLPYGGWRLDIRDERGSSQVGVCLDPSLVRPGREPRVGTLLFPSFAAWLRPLQQNWRCDDLTAVLQNGSLRASSQCEASDSPQRRHFSVQRSVRGHEVSSQTDEVLTHVGREVSRQQRQFSARFVGACTPNMTRVGDLGW
jgi:hypothetical protein